MKRRCPGCHEPRQVQSGTAADILCRTCKTALNNSPATLRDGIDGQWVKDNGVSRWVPYDGRQELLDSLTRERFGTGGVLSHRDRPRALRLVHDALGTPVEPAPRRGKTA